MDGRAATSSVCKTKCLLMRLCCPRGAVLVFLDLLVQTFKLPLASLKNISTMTSSEYVAVPIPILDLPPDIDPSAQLWVAVEPIDFHSQQHALPFSAADARKEAAVSPSNATSKQASGSGFSFGKALKGIKGDGSSAVTSRGDGAFGNGSTIARQ
jgi:hypothetical protein